MLHLGVEQDRDCRIEVEEAIHIFARLENEIVLLTEIIGTSHRSVGRARDYRGLKYVPLLCRTEKDLCAHRGAAALAVHTRNSHAVLIFGHYVAEIVGSRYAGYSLILRSRVFGVVGRDCNGIYHHTAILSEISRCVSVKHLYSRRLKLIGQSTF